MKKILLIAILFCICLPSFAQKIRFTDPTNVWSMLDSTTGCCIPIANAYVKGWYDTTASLDYNGHSYQYYVSDVFSFLVREDSGKVYVIGTDDSVERVLYNYNLVLHDTLTNIYPGDTLITYVTEYDSTQLGGLWYKTWHFEGFDHCPAQHTAPQPVYYNVIEGIGCTNGPYYPASPFKLNLFAELLLCFSNSTTGGGALSNAVAAYGDAFETAFDNSSSCSKFLTDTATHGSTLAAGFTTANKANVAVVPNPVTGDSKIVLPYIISTGTAAIMNALGQTIAMIPLTGAKEVWIGDKMAVPGIYYYCITDSQTGKIFSGKMVK